MSPWKQDTPHPGGRQGSIWPPKIIDPRGLIWPDQNSIGIDGMWEPAREGLRKRASVSGWVPFPHLRRAVWFESSLEMHCLDSLKEFGAQIGVFGQPMTLNQKVLGFGRGVYTADFLVWLIGPDGRAVDPVLVEVKYEQDLKNKWEKVHPKALCGLRFARRQGWRFALLTDRHLREPRPQRATWSSEQPSSYRRREARVAFGHLFPRWKGALS